MNAQELSAAKAAGKRRPRVLGLATTIPSTDEYHDRTRDVSERATYGGRRDVNLWLHQGDMNGACGLIALLALAGNAGLDERMSR